MGEWFAARPGARDKVLVATKLGMLPPNNGLSASQIETAVEASLKRLQTDRIDLYQSHKDDPATPLDETMEAFDRLVKAGKVRAVGRLQLRCAASRRGPARLQGDKGLVRYDSLQPAYNLMDRAIEAEDRSRSARRRMWRSSPTTRWRQASLSGKYRSEADLGKSARGGGVKKYLNDKGFAVLKALDEVSEAHGGRPRTGRRRLGDGQAGDHRRYRLRHLARPDEGSDRRRPSTPHRR